jgi:PKD repeat protein
MKSKIISIFVVTLFITTTFVVASDEVDDQMPPIAIFEWDPEFPDPQRSAEFDASSSYDPDGEIVSYQWDFGDGQIASGEKVSHGFSTCGEYTVTLMVTDNDDLSSYKSNTIIVGVGIIGAGGSIYDHTTCDYNETWSIVIWNDNKYVCSELHYEIIPPKFGTNWYIFPDLSGGCSWEGVITPLMGKITIVGQYTSPSTTGDWNGEIKIINKDNSDDKVTLDAYCHTPKSKQIIGTPFLNFLENHPRLFPILRLLLT